MGTTTLLECFACSRRIRWMPRPLRLRRPFQPIRCYPETAPPHWQCTYGDGQGWSHTAGNWKSEFMSCHVFNTDCFSFIDMYVLLRCLERLKPKFQFSVHVSRNAEVIKRCKEQRSSVVCRHCFSDNYDLFLIPPLSLPLTFLPSRVLPLVLMRPHGEQRDLPV